MCLFKLHKEASGRETSSLVKSFASLSSSNDGISIQRGRMKSEVPNRAELKRYFCRIAAMTYADRGMLKQAGS